MAEQGGLGGRGALEDTPPQWTVYCSVYVCVCVIRIGDCFLRKVFGALHELELAEKHQQGYSQACLYRGSGAIRSTFISSGLRNAKLLMK